MLTPEYLQEITDKSESLAAGLKEYIIKRIVRSIMVRLQRGEEFKLSQTNMWNIQTLQESDSLLADIMKEIKKQTAESNKVVKKAFKDAGITALRYEDAEYEAAGLAAAIGTKMSPEYIRILERNYEATKGELKNLTGTIAKAAQVTFIDACDEALFKVQTGTCSRSQAVKEAIDKAVKEGGTVIYPSGHKDTVETTTLRAVRTGIAKAAGDMALKRMAEMDVWAVLTSAHVGARSTPIPEPANHESWQGQVFYVDLVKLGLAKEYTKEAERAKSLHPDFIEKTGYGTGEGILGWNCRHSIGTWIDGVSKNNYEKIDTEENKKAYDLQQAQRKLERTIRKWKIQKNGYKEAMDKAEDDETREALDAQYQKAKEKVTYYNKKYGQFCEENDLKLQYDRLYVGDPSKKVIDKSEVKAYNMDKR